MEKEGILEKNINSGNNTVCFPAQITDGLPRFTCTPLHSALCMAVICFALQLSSTIYSGENYYNNIQ